MNTSLRPLFYELANECAQSIGGPVRRAHIYQLVAASLGYGSWESLKLQCVLAERTGPLPPLELAHVAGRSLQLGLEPGEQSQALAQAVIAAVRARDLRAVNIADFRSLMLQHGGWPAHGRNGSTHEDEVDCDFDDEDEDGDEFDELNALRASPVLHAALFERSANDPYCHLWLATLFRCREPSPYLHEQAQAGRSLNSTEKQMVNQYLRDAPRFQVYRHHLREAAASGLALAAIECARVFEEDHWLERARFDGDPELLVAAAESVLDDARANDLFEQASKLGSQRAFEHLAASGDISALEHMAGQGDRLSLVTLAARALAEGNADEAWTWQFVAQSYGLDLAEADARAYHSEGQHAGELYDDDVGGPLYVDELDVIDLPSLPEERLPEIRRNAEKFIANANVAHALTSKP